MHYHQEKSLANPLTYNPTNEATRMIDLNKLMKSAGSMMEQAQEDLKKTIVTGEAGAGSVTVQVNARHDVLSISLSDDIMTESKETIEELIAGALNNANSKIEEITQSKMMDAKNMFGDFTSNDNKD